MHYSHFFLSIILPTLSICSPFSPPSTGLCVETSSGVLDGFVDPSAPDVRQFLGVPYARPPTGSRRWLPPSKLLSISSINATNIGPACPQNQVILEGTSVYSPLGGNQTEFFPPAGGPFSEDCLTLNVWTPRNPKAALPVIVWYFGGGFVQGGTNSLYYNPLSWVQRTQEHIVVTVNFRSNIFGFPNAPHLAEQNLGLADMRLSLEWVEENIVKLGGHPSNIVVWGQSAGAIALDYLNFAYPSNPIASGMILDSSTALYPQAAARSFDTRQRNFTAVAASLGCNNTSSQLGCMRNVSWQAIEAALSADSTLSFIPVVDNVLLFENFTQRYEMGALSHIPAFIGSNLHEFNEGAPNVLSETFNQSVSDAKTDAVFLCTAAQTSKLRQTQGRITYRYRFDGNFSNISPSAYPGAYHASELPLVFGTAGDFHRPSTAYEEEVSRAMQDLWLDFAKNPEHGLNKSGFGPYGMGKAMLLGDVGVPVKEVDISQVDGVCSAIVAVL